MSDQSLDDSLDLHSALPLAPAADPIKKKRGFAVMDRARVQEFGRRGGVSAHVLGKAHEFSSDEARAAGRKGGMAANAGRRLSLAREATDVAAE
jgi:general stress protein YciG